MCKRRTLLPGLGRSLACWMALAILPMAARGQTGIGASPGAPDWRHIGGTAEEASSASVFGDLSGRVDRVWYSADGGTLFVRTASGRSYSTTDLEIWTATNSVPTNLQTGVLALPAGSPSVPGTIRDLAVSPVNPEEITVGTDLGVFRSADSGKSWTSLNDGLPNLPVKRLLNLPEGDEGVRIELAGNLAAEWPPGEKSAWLAADNLDVVSEAQLRGALSASLGSTVTAVALSGDAVYAGTADGELRASSDRGQTWQVYAAGSGKVERIWIDPADARIALAVTGSASSEMGAGAAATNATAHVFHTINGGGVWDNLTTNLPDVSVHGVTADVASGAIYLATDASVFSGTADLNGLGGSPNWTPMAGLPGAAAPGILAAPAVDVMLDAQGNQLWVAVDGYGVYATLAPHRYLDPRVVSAADLVARAVAPGSLISILGAQVTAVRAGDVTVPVLSATPAASQLQVPFNVEGNSLALVTGTATGATGKVFAPLQVTATAPAIFVGPDGTPMLLDADSGVMLDAMTPAHAGSRLQILASGLGQVAPEWPAGLAAPAENPPKVAAQVNVLLDRLPVEVTRAVLAPGYVGLYLVEITVPKISNYGPAELYIDMGGATSNRVRVYIEP
jgi:uncharacterized protein (TIGR03437 family)